MLSADDIAEIFEWIEMLLIGSLKRNLTRHENEEKKYGFNWSAWQAEKLRNLDKFRRENAAIVGKYTNTIDKNTRALLEEQFREGVNGAAREAGEAPEPQPVYMQDVVQPTQPELPEQTVQPEQPVPETTEQVSAEPPTAADEPIAVIKSEPQFFGVDTVKVNKLVEDMTTMEKQAETAALRMTDDVYRQTLNRVQLAMSTGSMTLNKAIDTAVEDFLNAGINCIEYKDGRRVNIADYVRMALRTTSTRAALQGHSEKLKALGYDTVAVSSYGMCSPTCLPYQGRVYINDAFTSWSGETQVRADGLTYGKSNYCGKWFPLLSSAIAGGLFHPNCRHGISMWRDGDPLPETLDNSETERRYKLEQQQRALEREIRRAKRRVEGFTDPENIAMAKAQLKDKQKQLREFIEKTNAEEGAEVLKRDSSREKSSAAELTDKEKNDIIKAEDEQQKRQEEICRIREEVIPLMPTDKVTSRQKIHRLGTKEYLDRQNFLSAKGRHGPSYVSMSDDDILSLVNKHKGTGIISLNKNGKWDNTELIVDNSLEIGTVVNDITGKAVKTSVFKIHYGNKGIHIVPDYPSKKKKR